MRPKASPMGMTLLPFLRQRSVQVLLVLGVYLATANLIPVPAQQGFYTFSLLLKDALVWTMPVTVGFFIAYTVGSFEKKAPLFVLTLLLFEALSNFSSVWYAFGSAHFASLYLPVFDVTPLHSDFTPLWRFPLERPAWWSADKGCFAGLILGVVAAFLSNPALTQVLYRGKNMCQWALTQVFARLIPLFILGFIAHMFQTRMLTHVLAHYAILIAWLVMFLTVYLSVLFFLGSGSFQKALRHIENLLPAGGIALTSGCSLSTMPWTIEGASKNMEHPQLAQAIIPATTNIQQIGDCIANAFLCFLVYKHFNGVAPDLMTWLQFSVVFVLARFATAAVLGGAIFIMLPIYETYLGFNGEMIAIIVALNMVLDPLITSCNVMANGALCRVFEIVWEFVTKTVLKKTCT